MEIQKIVNLLNDSYSESSNFRQENGMSLMIRITHSMVKEMKMIQALNLKQKLLNQIVVIIQTDIFL